MVASSSSVILFLALTVPIIAAPSPDWYQSSTCPDTRKCLDGTSPRCRPGGNRCEYERCYDGSYAPCSIDGPGYPQNPQVTQCQDRKTCPDGSSPQCRPGGNPCEWRQCYDGYNWAPCTTTGGNSWGGQYSPQPYQPPPQPYQPPPQPYQPPPPPQNGPEDTYQRQEANYPPQGYGNSPPPPPPPPPAYTPPNYYVPPPNYTPPPPPPPPTPTPSPPPYNYQPPPNNYQPPPNHYQPPPPNGYQPPPESPNPPPQDPYAHATDHNQTSCPATCNIQYNYCDKTTAPSCVPATMQAYNPRPYCACRPGYKATGVSDYDTTKQWRLPVQGQEHRVWVAEGVRCDTVCTGYGVDACKEIPVLGGECVG